MSYDDLAELFGSRCSRIFRPIATCMAFTVSVGLYLYPRGLVGDIANVGTVFHNTHGFIFHYLILLYFLLVVGLRLCKPRVRDALLICCIGLLYAALGLRMSYQLGANYNNFLESVIPFLEEFRLEYGQLKYTVVNVLAISVGAALSALLLVGFYAAIGGLIRLCFGRVRK